MKPTPTLYPSMAQVRHHQGCGLPWRPGRHPVHVPRSPQGKPWSL